MAIKKKSKQKDLTPQQKSFLMALNNHNEKLSFYELGRQHFVTCRSVYEALKQYIKFGYVNYEKEKKLIKVTLTRKGKNYLMNLFDNQIRKDL